MASEWNRGLRTAQRVLKHRMEKLPTYEGGMPGDVRSDPQVPGLRTAISEIEALIEPEES